MQPISPAIDPRALRTVSRTVVGVEGRLPAPPALPLGVEFRPVPGWPGLGVTSTGDVWSCRRSGRYRKNAAPRIRVGGQWKKLKPQPDRKGYLCVRPGGAGMVKLHHLVLLAFEGPRGEVQLGRHLDDDRLNNAASNLAWGSVWDNAQDKIRNGRQLRGEQCNYAKFTDAQIVEIRSLAGAMSQRAIARQFGTSQGHIWDILHNRRWRHVPDPPSPPESACA